MSTPTLAIGMGWYDAPAEPSPATDDSDPVAFHEVPSWMGYLLWFDVQASCWVLELRDVEELMFLAENRALPHADDVVAAQAWTAEYDTESLGEPPTWVWRRVTVCGKNGWTPIEDVDYRGNAMYHDLHAELAASIRGCCTWPATSATPSATSPPPPSNILMPETIMPAATVQPQPPRERRRAQQAEATR